jgi:hypothetical protein
VKTSFSYAAREDSKAPESKELVSQNRSLAYAEAKTVGSAQIAIPWLAHIDTRDEIQHIDDRVVGTFSAD